MEKLPKRIIAIFIVKYAALSILMLALSHAEIFSVSPFSTGLLFAYIFLGLPTAFSVCVFAAAELSASFSLYSALYILTVSGVAVSAKIAITAFSQHQKYLKPAFTILSQSGLIFIAKQSNLNGILLFVWGISALGFMYASETALRPILIEKLRYKLLEMEVSSIGLIMCCSALGLSGIGFANFPLAIFVAAALIFVAANISGFSLSAFIALAFGIGCGLKDYNPFYISTLVTIAAAATMFKNAPRTLSVLAGIVSLVAVSFYFNIDYTQNAYLIIAVAVGGVVFSLIPKNALKYLREYAFESHKETAVRYMLNKSRADTAASLNMSADIFATMSQALESQPYSVRGYTQGVLKARVCSFCKNFSECEKQGLFPTLDTMLSTGLEAGKISLGDIPSNISANCTQLAKLVSAALDVSELYKSQRVKAELEQNARQIVYHQLRGMSAVLRDIAKKSACPLSFDSEREAVLTEELNYSSIACVQSLIAGEGIALIVRTECFDRKSIEKIVSKVMHASYLITGIDDTILSGFSAISLSCSAPFDVVFGVAACAKEKSGESGDTHSFIKLDNSRFMIALCDGMGSGSEARRLSSSAISLVESFYRAGFDSDLVLYSVNRFLSLNGGEGFSALDVCVVDLKKAEADILKLGSPASYIKKKETVAKVDGNALPLGAVDEAVPSLVKVDLSAGDMLVMASDGVADSFSGDKLSSTVLNLKTLNPQTLAESVLEETINLNSGKPRDDSTVIAARLIRR